MALSMDLSSVSNMVTKVAYAMRFELSCALIFLALWLFGVFAGINKKRAQKPSAAAPHKKAYLNNYSGPSSLSSDHTEAKVAKAAAAHQRGPGRSGGTSSPWQSSEGLFPVASTAVVANILQLSRTSTHQALGAYQEALQQGLKLQELPNSDCRNLFVTLVTSLLRAGMACEAMTVLKDLRNLGPGLNVSLFSSVAKLCTSKHLFSECLGFYDFAVQDPDLVITDRNAWSCLLFCAIETRAYKRCGFFFDQLKECGLPSSKDHGHMIRLASINCDWRLALELLDSMHAQAVDVDSVMYNTALATCVNADQVDKAFTLLTEMEKTAGVADVITYNTLMKGYAKAGRMEQCFELREHMLRQRICPSQVTYGILLDGCINDNQVERAAGVVELMQREGCLMNTVLFTTLIKGFARASQVDKAMGIYEQMRADHSMAPDLITYSILIKANCDSGRLEEALKLLQSMLDLGLNPDEVVFNNLLAGCVPNGNGELAKRLYSDLVASGIKPSNATFSILIRIYEKCKQLDEAVRLLIEEPSLHGVVPEQRLFLQLFQCCIRERQGRRGIEVYEMMLRQSNNVVSAASHSTIMRTCAKLNMFETAAEILASALKNKARIDAQDVSMLLEAAIKKKKMQHAHSIASAMEQFGYAIQPGLLAQLNRSSIGSPAGLG